MSERNALANMPIWIQRCERRALCIKRIEGNTFDCKQISMLSSYMKRMVRNVK